ncbi:MAG TPA: hypothetical protein VFL91_06555 [Thermomicrobiales bacterium]|nr:hypothetical protein [Thermomicrobiales bacterium]
MNAKRERVRLLPFLAGAAIGSLCGVVIGALVGGPLSHALAAVTNETLERFFGRDDEELRFDLLLQ